MRTELDRLNAALEEADAECSRTHKVWREAPGKAKAAKDAALAAYEASCDVRRAARSAVARATILDAARSYDKATGPELIGARYGIFHALVSAGHRPFLVNWNGGDLREAAVGPSGKLMLLDDAFRAWVAAARRADAKTRGPGQPAKGRPNRRTVRTTDATEAGLVRIAEAAGRGVPDVASELLEGAVKAKGGCDE